MFYMFYKKLYFFHSSEPEGITISHNYTAFFFLSGKVLDGNKVTVSIRGKDTSALINRNRSLVTEVKALLKFLCGKK